MMGSVKAAPSAYNALHFHFIRFVQFIAAATVIGTTFFFVNHLWHNKSPIPWMFYFLQGAACFTVLWLLISSILKFTQRFSPTVNGIANCFAAVVWIVAFGLLTNRMRWVIIRQCTKAMWADDAGVTVCRLYKLNFSAAVIGIASTIAAIALDIRTRNAAIRRGKYITAPTITENETKAAMAYKASEDERYSDRAVLLEERSLRAMAPSPYASRDPSPMRSAK